MKAVLKKFNMFQKPLSLTAIFMLCFSAILFAQDPKKDLQRMTALYRSATAYSMDISLNLFSDQSDFNQQHKGKACKNGDYYFSQLMGRTTLFNDKCNLLVDENRKLIIYNKPVKNKKEKFGQEEQLLTDSSFYATAKLRYISQNEKQRKIEVKSNTGEYEKMEIVLNAQSGALEKVIYYYNKSTNNGAAGYTKSEITYSNILINKAIPAETFSEKKYIIRKDKIWKGTGIYAAFQIVDQTQPVTPKR